MTRLGLVRSPGSVRVGEWVALGLRWGRCPVGRVVERTDETVVLDLVNYADGQPMDYHEISAVAEVQAWAVAPVTGEPMRAELAILWEFQTRWFELDWYRWQDPAWRDELAKWYGSRVNVLRRRLISGEVWNNLAWDPYAYDKEGNDE